MTRNEFINTLFDNGDGLTLKQISMLVYDVIPETIPEGMIEDMENSDPDIDHNTAVDLATEMAYEKFIQDIADCEDLIEIAELLSMYLKDVTDKQILRLRYCATIER